MANPVIGQGVIVSIGQGDAATVGDATDVFDAIGKIESVGAADQVRDQVEVTNFDSAEKEYINGLKDTPEIEFGMKYDPADAGQVSAAAAFDSGELRNFRVAYPTTPVQTAKFQGVVVKRPNPEAGGTGDAITASMTIRRRSAVTWA